MVEETGLPRKEKIVAFETRSVRILQTSLRRESHPSRGRLGRERPSRVRLGRDRGDKVIRGLVNGTSRPDT